MIVNAICSDGNGVVGYDEFGQLVYSRNEGRGAISTFIRDVRKEKCAICGGGWTETPKSMANQFYHSAREKWMHETCYVGVLAHNEHEKFFYALVDAKLKFSGLREIPNEYGGAWNTTWYETDLLDHPGAKMKFGSRKRVDVVSLSGADMAGLFEHEDVTKDAGADGVMIHAWSDEKVREYVKEIAKRLKEQGASHASTAMGKVSG
jgi:hypothetical protein